MVKEWRPKGSIAHLDLHISRAKPTGWRRTTILTRETKTPEISNIIKRLNYKFELTHKLWSQNSTKEKH